MNLKSLAASRLAGRPWAIAPARLDALLAGAAAFTIGTELPPWLQHANRSPGFTVTESSIAVVPVLGSLVARGDWLTALLGASEYGGVADAVSSAADDPAVRGIVLEVDSPGGEVGGLFDLVDGIRAIRQRSAKPLWAVASEAALSAAYAIASAADRLYVSRTGEVGSVGVVAVHLDESGADAIADRLRAEFSEIATVVAQAARLGIDIDAADAMRRGLKPDALRQTIIESLAVRSEAADVVAIAPQPAQHTGDSPIVKRARERAAGKR